MRGRTRRLWTTVAVVLCGCRGEVTADPPIVVERNMYVQERYDPQARSTFFPDHAAMRPIVVGAVARERFEDDEGVASGVVPDGTAYVMSLPDEVVSRGGGLRALAGRGRERFDIYCAPCHGRAGDGKGIVARIPFGFPPLPSLHDPRIRNLPDGQIFATITHGVRLMPSYAAQVPTDDRWAIVAYLRALELSELARTEERTP